MLQNINKYKLSFFYFFFFFKIFYIFKFFNNIKLINFYIFNFIYLKKNLVLKIINFKKKNILLKKNNYFTHNSIFKLWKILKLKKKFDFDKKRFFLKKIEKNTIKLKFFKFFLKEKFNLKKNNKSKIIDFKKKFFLYLTQNFKLLKLFFNIKKKVKNIIFFLKKITKKSITKIFFFFEFLLWNLIIKVFRLISLSDALFLIKNNFVFVNGIIVNNSNYYGKANDCIQLKFNKNILYFFKNYLNFLKKKMFKLKKKFWYVLKFKKNLYKQMALNNSSWLVNLFWYKKKLPLYLEYDYLTFSFFFIFLPSNLFYFNSTLTKNLNFYLFYLYNWKKIS